MTSGWQQGPGPTGPSGWGPPDWVPAAWSGISAPVPVEPAGPRPPAVVAGVAAWAAAVGCTLVTALVSLTHVDDQVAEARRRSAFGSPGPAGTGFLHHVLLAASVFALVWTGVYAVFVLLAWQGRNWARIVLWVLGGLAMFGVAGFLGAPPGRAALLAAQLVLTLAGVVLLALPPAHGWYRRRGAELAAGRRR